MPLPNPAPTLADHLHALTDHLADFRNTVDSPQRRNLLGALRAVEQEARARDVALADSAAANAAALARLPSAGQLAEAIGIREIVGAGPYEALDHRWAESVLNYYQTGNNRVAFPTHLGLGINPLRNLVADGEIRIALAGDLGADARLTPPAAICALIAGHNPHYTIHLGDVYYSGLPEEEADNFLKLWSPGSAASYTLNSNHEMYCGGRGYFQTLLGDGKFAAQQGLSYFALTNDHWLIVGLDTAYFAYYQSLLYEEGFLAEPDPGKEPRGLDQLNWLRGVLREHGHKRVILLTHHDGFDVNPATGKVSRKPLFQQVSTELSAVRDWWWYFGHVHAGIAYYRLFFGNNSSLSARCVGHGAVPYEPFPPHLERLGDGAIRIQWAETDYARNGGDPRRAPNGFMLLTLRGAELREEFYDELGRQRWSNF